MSGARSYVREIPLRSDERSAAASRMRRALPPPHPNYRIVRWWLRAAAARSGLGQCLAGRVRGSAFGPITQRYISQSLRSGNGCFTLPEACTARIAPARRGPVRGTWLLLLLFAVGCLAPFVPADAVPFQPPRVYLELWKEVEACSGMSGEFGLLEWFVVVGSDDAFSCPEHAGHCDGWWEPPHDIYLAEAEVNNTATHYRAVRHEMLHDLLRTGEHPAAFETCGLR